MKYQGHTIELGVWDSGKPWPDSIVYDGVKLDYAHEWENIGGRQLISYRKGDELRRYRIERKALLELKAEN